MADLFSSGLIRVLKVKIKGMNLAPIRASLTPHIKHSLIRRGAMEEAATVDGDHAE
jgi:hypothetical protein